MKIIAIMTPKGGVGKTITATSISYILGQEYKKRILVVDADQQGNASKLYNRYDPEGLGMPQLLEKHCCCGGRYTTHDLILPTQYDYIDIITANGYLMVTNANLLKTEDRNQITRFKNAMQEIKDIYDYVIVDCGLIMDLTVTNVLLAADLLITPVMIGGSELEALDEAKRQLLNINNINKKLEMKALMTMRQGNKFTQDVEEYIKTDPDYNAFATSIRRSIVVAKSTYENIPLPKKSKRCIATQDYRNLVWELLKYFKDL